MSAPSWQSVSGPPPGPAPKAAAKPRKQMKPRFQGFAPPAPGTHVSLEPPVQRVVHPLPESVGRGKVCLQREGDSKLSDCGRLLQAVFSDHVTSGDYSKITCTYCLWRIERRLTHADKAAQNA